ncbi:MAG: YggS family pyridoxal phosphate-dependent enzyme [Clostridiales bacterium]|nr:YggS family pyridoxal phosphate-dependent enzyme [Clostridiales bacterium]MCF8021339.1 YggS family pyridoxal phosphate-dependent enzyme [Clostridiales bacterium]
MSEELRNNLLEVHERIKKAAERSGRSSSEIQLIAVSKTIKTSRIEQLVNLGIENLGENKVQELAEKIPCLHGDINWHMIGHLQSNKVKYIVDKVTLIHSLDRLSLAEEIQKKAEQKNVYVPVLIQVNASGENSKFGIEPGEVENFILEVAGMDRIKIKGLMNIAPFVDNPEEVRPVFRRMRELFNRVDNKYSGVSMEYLSMGMTGDFEVAIEEGANMVRIGSAIFGSR